MVEKLEPYFSYRHYISKLDSDNFMKAYDKCHTLLYATPNIIITDLYVVLL
jgi:hypothetical protein